MTPYLRSKYSASENANGKSGIGLCTTTHFEDESLRDIMDECVLLYAGNRLVERLKALETECI